MGLFFKFCRAATDARASMDAARVFVLLQVCIVDGTARARIRKLSAVSPSAANESKKILTHLWPSEWELGSF
jgi:hypothetical protein